MNSKIKTILTITVFYTLNYLSLKSQVSATYNEVSSGEKKGQIDTYISKSGEIFNVGDTITIGISSKTNYQFIQQDVGYPLNNIASNSKVRIKKIVAGQKMVNFYTTKANGYVYGLVIMNVERALEIGEIKSKILSSDEALSELKKWKDKLELGLINQEEYEKKKEELVKYIK